MNINIHYVFLIAIVSLGIYWLNTDEYSNPEQTSVQDARKEDTKKNKQEPSTRERYLQSVAELNLSDKELEKCIIGRFGLSTIKPSSIKELKILRCNTDNIKFLDGIQALSNLESITMIGTDIQDATPLAGLRSLQKIYLKGGNENILNIRALSQLEHLKKMTFPHMLDTYCHEAKTVVKSMKENIEGNTSNNLNLVHCRGKKTTRVTKVLRKIRNNQPLSLEEQIALSDYENNLNWSN